MPQCFPSRTLAGSRSAKDSSFWSETTAPQSPYNVWNSSWRHIQQASKDHIDGKHTPLDKAEYILPHEMRHITASLLGEQRETLTTIQDMLGHLTPAMSDHYRHILERSRRELADRWGGGITSKQQQNPRRLLRPKRQGTVMAEIEYDSKIAPTRPPALD